MISTVSELNSIGLGVEFVAGVALTVVADDEDHRLAFAETTGFVERGLCDRTRRDPGEDALLARQAPSDPDRIG